MIKTLIVEIYWTKSQTTSLIRGITKYQPNSKTNSIHRAKPLLKITKHRSSHRRYSVRKDVLRNFAKLTGKHLCQSLYFNKVAGVPESLF